MTKEELLQTYFYIEDISGSTNTVSITKNNASVPTLIIEYSYDTLTWNTITMNTDTTANTFTIPANGKLYLRGVNNGWGSSSSNYNIITASANHNVGGNIMSLLYGSEFEGKEVFPTTNTSVLCGLFYGNTTLIKAKDLQLPATTLAKYCYCNMFAGCTSLTTAPELLATTLADSCYYRMFYGCSSLTTAPALPATTLADSCYYEMFAKCSSLTTAPALPATTLANSCYKFMFSNCTNLTTAPELPATTLANSCYASMFASCTSLTTAPALPATTLVNSCYQMMFRGCSQLNYIKADFINYNSSYQSNWLSGVSSTGTFVMNPKATYNPEDIRNTSGIPIGWTVKTDDIQIPNYFYIEDISGSTNTVTITQNSTNALTLNLEYSTDTLTWNTITIYSITATVTIPVNGKLYLRGVNNNLLHYTITAKGNHNVGGNIMSLLYGNEFEGKTSFQSSSIFSSLFNGNTTLVNAKDLILPATTLAQSCYSQMFQGCKNLTTAPELPATTLTTGCYQGMFRNCTSLTTAPELPATTLADSCYNNMFGGCTSLTTAPELPVTTLAPSCYSGMFSGCTGLTTAPELPATTLANYCYQTMFSGCTGLITTPELPATTLATSCYDNMFYECKNLTTVLELPATTLADSCYYNMFFGCSSLTTVPSVLPATTLADKCYNNMFNSCKNLTTTPELPATILAYQCYLNMFRNCTSLTTASELPATTLVDGCYNNMFNGCSSLTIVPSVLPATTLTTGCYQGMFRNCTSLTTAPELPATTLARNCYSYMFNGCSKLNYIQANFIEYDNSQTQFSNWVVNVSSTGTFVINPKATYNPEDIRNNNGIPTGWNVETAELPPLTYCYIQTTESNTLIIHYQNDNINLEYSFGDDIWKSINHTTNIEFIDVIYLRGNNTSLNGVRIKTSKESTLNGNIMALLYGDDYEDMVAFPEGSTNTFKYLFLGYDKCLDISNLLLPATELAPNCYHHMFTGCIKLKSIPELPADNLTNYCYHGMFMDCDGIDKATLSAQYLAPYAYSNMFLGSDNLNEVTTNFIEFDETSLKGWLKDVNPEGNLYLSKEYPYDIEETKDILYVPDGWDIN